MNVIMAYLETMFSAYPQTPRLLEAKAELRGMMEDAYTSLIAKGRSENEAVGQVIRDFGNLEEVAPVLGIASTIDSPTPETPSDTAAPLYPPVTREEAQGYADAQHRVRYRISTAVMLFVLSPALLIALPVAAGSGLLAIMSSAAALIGLLFLFVLVAVGVMVIIAASRETAPYEHIEEGHISVDPQIVSWADELSAEHEHGRIRALQLAIALWILAPIPLIALALLLDGSPQQDFWAAMGVVLILVFVAAGLGVLLPRNWANTVAENLGSRSRPALHGVPRSNGAGYGEYGIVSVIASFYWPLLTVAFLAWGFIGNAWGISWIIWPLGAVFFSAIAAGCSGVENYRRAQRREHGKKS